MRFLPALSILITAISTSLGHAQEVHSKASLVMDGDSFVNGMRIGVQVDLEKGWHTYWENPGDVGAPASMDISSSQQIEQSDLTYPIPHRIRSDPFDFYGFENEVLFYKTVSMPSADSSKPVDLKIRFDWLVCQELCIPASKTFDITLPLKNAPIKLDPHFNSFEFPKNLEGETSSVDFQNDKTILKISSDQFTSLDSADFFPASTMNQIFNKPISKSISGKEITLIYPQTKSRDKLVHGVIKLDEKTAYWIGQKSGSPAEIATVKKTNVNIFYILFFAFLGGVLLNFMPCVLPVVSLKILSVLKSTDNDRTNIKKSNLVYTLGIWTTMLLLAGAFVFFQKSGEQLGWGFQLQSPGFVTFLVILFFGIGLNLIGFFEINSFSIPGIGKILRSESLFSEFLGGILITFIATPCTAPFMAAAVGVALAQPPLVIFMTFFSLGVGLSTPYLALVFYPRMASILPRPGLWMIKLKELLSFPMFFTVGWLIWILNRLTDTKATLFILSALVMVVFFFWAKQKLFSVESPFRKFFLALIAVGTFSLLLFPLQLQKSENISWEPFDASQTSSYGKDRVTFVDFTADWCITCKANERFTFSNKEVLETIQNQNIRMIKADWTRRDPSITALLRSYDRAGVPFYLLYKPGLTTPEILPTLLTPGLLIEAFKK